MDTLNRRLLLAISGLFLLATLAGCKGEEPATPAPAPPPVRTTQAPAAQPAETATGMWGAWQQSDDDSIRLRLEQQGEAGVAYLSASGGEDWLGPLKLKARGTDRGTFRMEPVVRVEGNTRMEIAVPSASKNPEYVTDANSGRTLVIRSEHLVKEGQEVTLQLQGSQLLAEGLWVRAENRKWDTRTGEPKEQKITPLQTTLVRAK